MSDRADASVLKSSSRRAGSIDLEIVREFSAARSRVWRAWTQPEFIVRWLGPIDWPAIEVTANVEVGGAWRAGLRSATSDEVLWQSGRYLVIEPPERLEFTFAWEGSNHEDGPGVETHVVVLLEETAADRTRMQFTQTGLVSRQSAAGHSHGWDSTFGRLDRFLREQPT